MRLSLNFMLDELLVSQTAARRGLANVPPPDVVEELRRLCEELLQPLRDALGVPVVVTSGYRSRAVNAAVGGAVNSAHLHGRAADIVVPGMAPVMVCRRIVELALPFDQVIEEFGAWTHVAIAPPGAAPRRQQLTARRSGTGSTVYTAGPI
jgi:zinc D-Ala-D-Ala carboxypeptidase